MWQIVEKELISLYRFNFKKELERERERGMTWPSLINPGKCHSPPSINVQGPQETKEFKDCTIHILGELDVSMIASKNLLHVKILFFRGLGI